MQTPELRPLEARERINSLDVLRGVALLGILLMNIAGFGLFRSYDDPTVMGGYTGLNLKAWITTSMLFEGTMRAMFSMLFGVGMVVMTSRMEQRGGGIQVADIYYRRTLWLLFFGLVHAYLILWTGEILYAYGLCGLLLFPFRNVAPSKLVGASVVLIMFGVALDYYQYSKKTGFYEKHQLAQNYRAGEVLPPDIKKGSDSWKEVEQSFRPTPDVIKENVAAMHKGYVDLVLHLAPVNRWMQSEFHYDHNAWDVLPMMLLGIALFRLRVITAELSFKTYGLMILFGYTFGLLINYREVTTIIDGKFGVRAFLEAGLTYPFGRMAMAAGHIGVVMIFCKVNVLVFLRKALAAVGKMALTNYIMHSVICAFVFTGLGFSLFGRLQRYELYYVVFSIWIVQLVVSPLWLMYFHFGPLEWAWRSLTYKKVQPFRRDALIQGALVAE